MHMFIYGLREISSELEQLNYFVKALVSPQAILFFSSLIQPNWREAIKTPSDIIE